MWLELYWELWGEGWCLSITAPTPPNTQTHAQPAVDPCVCCSACQPEWEKEGEGARVLKWGIGRHFLRNAGSYQKWHVTVSAVRSHALSLLCCWLFLQFTDGLLSEPESLAGSQSSCLNPILIRTFGRINILKNPCGFINTVCILRVWSHSGVHGGVLSVLRRPHWEPKYFT